jgi:hypothetical protein
VTPTGKLNTFFSVQTFIFGIFPNLCYYILNFLKTKTHDSTQSQTGEASKACGTHSTEFRQNAQNM